MPDLRGVRGRRHHIADVLFISLVAVIAGMEDAETIEDYAEANEAWFRERCGLTHGIRSQDTYLRVLATEWAGLAGIAVIERTRQDKASSAVSKETSYYIYSDRGASAEHINQIVHAHWAIENGLHWVLDVTLDEDLCRIRSGDAAENLATIRRAALNLLRTAPPPPRTRGKVSLARRRRFCLMDPGYLETVLRLPPVSTVP